MVDKTFAWKFAREWASAWNAHDLPGVLSHYTDDFEMTSPFIGSMVGNADCKLKGKVDVGAYWRAALDKFPDLHFEIVNVFYGADSVVVYYQSVLGKLAAEVFWFNADGKVYQAIAHYDH